MELGSLNWLSRYIQRDRSASLRYGFAFLTLIVTAMIVYFVDIWLGVRLYSMVLADVVVVAIFGGFGPTLFVSIAGALYLDYLDEGSGTITVFSIQSLIRIGLFIAISSVISALINFMRITMKSTEESRRLAEQANKEKDALLGVIVHDLKNPVGVIAGYTDLLLENPRSEEEESFLRIIKNRCDSMLELIGELLDFASLSQNRLVTKSCDLVELVKNVASLEQALARKKSIELIIGLPLKPIEVLVDGPRLERAIYNLIDNAIKYSPASSQISVRMYETARELVVEVQDQGPGLSREEQRLLFKPFSRTSNQPTGGESSTGLGLFIADQIAHAHGGFLEVESEKGHGAKFSFHIPYSKE